MTLIAVITIFILAVFVGLEVISKVPQTLHTPLMSATNAIHGVILVGASSSWDTLIRQSRSRSDSSR